MGDRRYNDSQLNIGLIFGLLSIAGVFIPALGVILAIVAGLTIKNVPTDKYTSGKKAAVAVLIGIGVVASLVSFIIWVDAWQRASL